MWFLHSHRFVSCLLNQGNEFSDMVSEADKVSENALWLSR